MAVDFDSATDVIGATSGGAISGNVEAHTICGFSRIETNLAQTMMLAACSDALSYLSSALEWRAIGADTMNLRCDTTAGVSTRTAFASRPAVGEYFFWYLKCSGTGAGQVEGGWGYLDGSAMVTQTETLESGAEGAVALIILGGLISADMRGQMAGVRMWSAALSAEDLENERYATHAVRHANLIGDYPLWDVATSLTDFSGNGAALENLGGLGGSAPSDTAISFPVRIRPGRSGRAIPAAAALLDQTRYRFRNDDGSETTATWAAAENTTISLSKNTPKRLRVQVQTTGNVPSASYKLQYRKVGDIIWRDVK